MSQKNILFIIVIILLLCIGMWRYAVLWQTDQQWLSDSTIGLVSGPVMADVERFWIARQASQPDILLCTDQIL